ncbi:hypothetical protein ACJX0J_038299, partial [Zea mays]
LYGNQINLPLHMLDNDLIMFLIIFLHHLLVCNTVHEPGMLAPSENISAQTSTREQGNPCQTVHGFIVGTITFLNASAYETLLHSAVYSTSTPFLKTFPPLILRSRYYAS